MMKGRTTFNFSFLLHRLLCLSLVLMLACNQQGNFQREIAFSNDWMMETNHDSREVLYFKSFPLDLQNEQLCFLHLSSNQSILQLSINQNVINGESSSDKTLIYNISDHLKAQNTIEVKSRKGANLNASLHCVNKLFIPDLTVKINNSNQAQIQVSVKNAFNNEKQGVLKYTMYCDKKKVLKKETPLIISGNAENTYRQEIPLDNGENLASKIKVVCSLYSDGKLFDQNQFELDLHL